MAGHKPQPQFVDTDGIIEQQARLNAEALLRARLRNNPTAPAELADTGGVDIAVRDAQLSWGGGQQSVSPSGHGDIPFDGHLAVVAGVEASGPMPDPGADYPHGCNMAELCNYGGRK